MKTMEKTQKLLHTIKQVGSCASKGIKRRRREFEKIHIPNEIIEEIMVKLPVRSLMRFQTVSKHWRSLIRSKDFRERHMALEQTKECKLLLVSNDFEDYVSFKTVALERTSASVVDEKALEFEILKRSFKISQSCDGLVCLYDSNKAVKVINPATRMFIQLPLSRIQQICIHKHDPDSVQDPNPVSYPVQDPNPVPYPGLSFSQFGFGKDSVTGRYKIVWLYNIFPSTTTMCEFLDLEEKTWRFVNTNTLDHHNILNYDQEPVFANGSLYWLTGNSYGGPTPNTKLIVFDIHTEMFQVVQTPPFINSSDTHGDDIGLCNLHGLLCISKVIGNNQEFWWRVKDSTWESIFSVHLPSTFTLCGVCFRLPLTPLAICRDTNKVILALRNNGDLVAVDLNPDHSTDYHLYFSGFHRLVVPYFPSLSLSFY